MLSRLLALVAACVMAAAPALAQTNNANTPTWWNKYEYLLANGAGIDFGSDPTLAFDASGNVYYGYIVVYFGNGNGINGTAVGVARSTDGGKTYPQFTLFSQEGGEGHFNDKPMITADANPAS